MNFILTMVEPHVACMGMGFLSITSAYKYALSVREFGLCEAFIIGAYVEGKYKELLDSRKPIETWNVNLDDERIALANAKV